MYLHYHPAPLDEDTLRTVKALESQLGKVVVAWDPDPPAADLSEEQAERLKRAEQRLGKVLVAYAR